jgi:TolA-binding protein
MFANHPIRLVLTASLAALLAVSAARADEADDLFDVAAGNYDRGQWKFAVQEFQTYLERYPQHAKASRAVFFLAEALLQQGRIDEAAGRFREYLKRDPGGPLARQAMFRAGEAEYLAGRTDQAKPQLEQFLTKYPDDRLNAYTLAYLGEIALAAKDYRAAKDYFQRGLSGYPQGKTQDECRFGLARSLDRLGEADEAERLYLAVAAKAGNGYADSAQFYLGALQYAQGRSEDALASFKTLDASFPDSSWRPTVQLGRGWALLKLGRPAEAAAAFESIVEDSKSGVEARYWLGITQKQLKQWKQAAATLLKAAEANPQHRLLPSIRLHAGDALLHTGDAAAAREQFDQVLALSGASGELADDALRGKMQAALLTKDYRTLDQLASQFDTRFPGSPLRADVRRTVARSLLDRKEFQRAAAIFESFVSNGERKDPMLEDRYLLALCYEGLHRPEDALATLEPVLRLGTGPLQNDARFVQASQLFTLKRFQEAIAPLEAFLSTESEEDQAIKARGQLAVCYARTGQMPKAKEVYGEVLKKYPGHELITPITEQMAEAAYDAGEVNWAGRLYKWLGRDAQAPGFDQRGLSGLAWSHFKAGRLDEAAAAFEQLLQKNPDAALASEAAYMRGQILQQLGKTDQALEMYDTVITKYPGSVQAPDALWAAARLDDALGQHQRAVTRYQELVAKHSKFAEIDAVLYKLAWAQSDLGQAKESTATFDRLRKEHPQSRYWADSVFRLAQRAFEAKDYSGARALTTSLLDSKPATGIRENAIYLWGQISAAESKWEEARQAFETLLKDHPQSALRTLAEYGIAEAYFRERNYSTATERLQRLVRDTQGRRDPWLAVVHLRLAQALIKEEKWEDAYAAASRIETQFPGFKEQYEADYVVGLYRSNQADFDAARKAYRKVIHSPSGAKTETAAKAQFWIAESYFHQKNYEEALREYLRLEILYAYPTWQAASVLQAAKCHEFLGEWKEAVQQYNRLLKTYPQTEFTKEATERLRAAQQRQPNSAS